MKLLLVEWMDSMAMGGWRERVEKPDTSHCVTVGIVTYEDEDKIRLSSSYDCATEHIAESITIPKCSIVKTMRVKVK